MSHESWGSEEAEAENDEGLILIYKVCVAIDSNYCTYVIEGGACQMSNFKPDEIGNYALGDMTLNKEQLEYFLGVKKVGRSGFKDPTRKWDNGLVPYKFSDEITEDEMEKVNDAFKIVNSEFEGCINVRL